LNFFILILIKNYLFYIKIEKSGNVLMLIGGGKYKKNEKKKCVNSNSTMLFCFVFYQTSPEIPPSKLNPSFQLRYMHACCIM
jgi:hypothetical protein